MSVRNDGVYFVCGNCKLVVQSVKWVFCPLCGESCDYGLADIIVKDKEVVEDEEDYYD